MHLLRGLPSLTEPRGKSESDRSVFSLGLTGVRGPGLLSAWATCREACKYSETEQGQVATSSSLEPSSSASSSLPTSRNSALPLPLSFFTVDTLTPCTWSGQENWRCEKGQDRDRDSRPGFFSATGDTGSSSGGGAAWQRQSFERQQRYGQRTW
jgi:hypothetical protein